MIFFKSFGIRIKLWWLRKRAKALLRASAKAERLIDVLDRRLGKLQEQISRLEKRYKELHKTI